MTMGSIAMIIVLGAATIGFLIYGLSMVAGRRKAILAERLETYAGIEEEAALAADAELKRLSAIPRLFHLLAGPGYIQKVEDNLTRADIPMRASEYILLRLVLAGVGFACGVYALGYLQRNDFGGPRTFCSRDFRTRPSKPSPCEVHHATG